MEHYQLPIRYFLIIGLICLLGCKEKVEPNPIKQNGTSRDLHYATGFDIQKNQDFTTLEVSSAWPGSKKSFRYALVPREKLAVITLPADAYDAIVPIPVERSILTSTTHIASLELLDELHTAVGFPGTDYISSAAARELVNSGQIQELGTNENLNTEITLAIQPDVVFGFGIDDVNKGYTAIKKSGIPVVYVGDWAEQTPLGKAEWIKFFAPFFEKETEANQFFETVERDYKKAKALAQKAQEQPTVITGGLYKDVWYVAGGKSWLAQFLKDANANYLWSETTETGSIGLSLEAVLEKGQAADFWLNPSMHTSYEELRDANIHHEQFKAFQQKKVFSNAIKKGEKGGLVFYELAPQRPDLVLKDLIRILHPELLPEYKPRFILPLE